jgi:hypothetical protein
MTHTEEKKQSIEADPKLTQTIERADKDIINVISIYLICL